MLSALLLLQVQPEILLPAHTAFLLNSEAAQISEDGRIEGWHERKAQLLWGGRLDSTGTLTVALELAKPLDGVQYRLLVAGPSGTRAYPSIKGSARFEGVRIPKSGWHQLTIQGTVRDREFGVVTGLRLTGDAAVNAKFNLKPRKNAASVHIGYPVDAGTEVEWFYNEIKAVDDPIHTYYMACGFARGYFGMQVNGPAERRIIFSIWDAGNEGVDRSKVKDDDLVKLLGKGQGVYTDGFGNEGTGGHSHLVWNWKTRDRQRFLVRAQKDGTGTIYTGYYFVPEKQGWMLIASFRAPKDGKLLRGLYSFSENFWGDTGHLRRSAIFGSAWIRTLAGDWRQLSTGRFTHDSTGGNDRLDYDLKPLGTRFLLQHGGFEGSSPAFGTLVHVPADRVPKIDLDKLPKPQL